MSQFYLVTFYQVIKNKEHFDVKVEKRENLIVSGLISLVCPKTKESYNSRLNLSASLHKLTLHNR